MKSEKFRVGDKIKIESDTITRWNGLICEIMKVQPHWVVAKFKNGTVCELECTEFKKLSKLEKVLY